MKLIVGSSIGEPTEYNLPYNGALFASDAPRVNYIQGDEVHCLNSEGEHIFVATDLIPAFISGVECSSHSMVFTGGIPSTVAGIFSLVRMS